MLAIEAQQRGNTSVLDSTSTFRFQKVAKQTKHILEKKKLLDPSKTRGNYEFYTNVNSHNLIKLLGDEPNIELRELDF